MGHCHQRFSRFAVFERFPRLGERRKQKAGSLSGGEQQMLAVGRALLASPRLLMLDEPSMGLAPLLVNEIFEIIKSISGHHQSLPRIVLLQTTVRQAGPSEHPSFTSDSWRCGQFPSIVEAAVNDVLGRMSTHVFLEHTQTTIFTRIG